MQTITRMPMTKLEFARSIHNLRRARKCTFALMYLFNGCWR